MKRAMSWRASGLVAVCGLSLALSSAMAMPPVVERLPDDALMTIVIPSPQSMSKNLAAMGTAVESPFPVPALDDVLAMVGVTGGIDTTKSMAIVIFAPKEKPKVDAKAAKDDAKTPVKDGEKGADKSADKGGNKGADKSADKAADAGGDKKAAKKKAIVIDDEDTDADEQRMVVLVPISKYEDFLGNFGAKPAGEGKVDSFASPSGDDAYAKDLGNGYAVMGEMKELVEGFTGKSGGGAASIKSRMGKAGEALADASDIVAIINMDQMRPLATKGLAEMQKKAKEKLEDVGQAQEQNLAMAKWIGETVVRDTQLLVGGAKFGSMGMSVDMVGAFKPDSYLAKAFAGKGNSAPLLSKLPGGSYLLAGAIDLSSPGVKSLMKDIVSKIDLPGGPEGAKTRAAMLDNSDGIGAVMGFPVGGAFAGLLTSTVLYTQAKDPAAALKSFKDGITTMNDQKVQNVTYTTKYVEKASKAGETPIDAWEIKFAAADGDEMPAQMQQAMPFLFGPQGSPVGYVAKGENGIYSTYAKNTELMTKALGASKGENMGADSMLRQSQEMLPKDRIGEAYIGTRGILDLALPFAAMAGMTVPADKIPEKLPPIAAGLSSQDGSMRLTLVFPAPVLKTGISLGMELSGAMGGGEGGAKAKPEKGAGQPKF